MPLLNSEFKQFGLLNYQCKHFETLNMEDELEQVELAELVAMFVVAVQAERVVDLFEPVERGPLFEVAQQAERVVEPVERGPMFEVAAQVELVLDSIEVLPKLKPSRLRPLN